MRKFYIWLLLAFSIVFIVGCTEPIREIPETQFTAETLAKYDGQDGNPAYIAIDGLVYDVSNHNSWKSGKHHGFVAGKDLSAEFNKKHKTATLRKLPIMGTYIES
ncbi:hypothetical protein FACS1894132_00240 [Clostridia bacterium]|nr:hypothetical protein FACS1894132_00240 [Clostridia bacterium]